MTSPIDLASLPLPDAVEVLDYETILSALKQVMVALLPDAADELQLESSAILKVLQVCAMRELLLRARVNDSVCAVMLATATGADLDGLVAMLGGSARSSSRRTSTPCRLCRRCWRPTPPCAAGRRCPWRA